MVNHLLALTPALLGFRLSVVTAGKAAKPALLSISYCQQSGLASEMFGI